MPPVVLYGTRFCSFCLAARRLLDEKGITFEDISVDTDLDLRMEIMEKSGQKTAFLSITILDHPTLDWAGTQNFKGIENYHMCFGNCGTIISFQMGLWTTKQSWRSWRLIGQWPSMSANGIHSRKHVHECHECPDS